MLRCSIFQSRQTHSETINLCKQPQVPCYRKESSTWQYGEDGCCTPGIIRVVTLSISCALAEQFLLSPCLFLLTVRLAPLGP